MIATVATYCLTLAVESGNINILRMLLKLDGVNAGTSGNSVVLTACANGDIEMVKLLIARNDVNVTGKNNEPFQAACSKGHLDLVRYLLTIDGVDPRDNENRAFWVAAQGGNLEVTQLLLSLHAYDTKSLNKAIAKASIDPSAFNNLAIRNAAKFVNLQIVQELLNTGKVDPSANDNEAFRNAARKGNLEMVKLLLKDPRVDPSAADNTAFIDASSQEGKLEIVKMLLELDCVDHAAQDNLALRKAAESGHCDVVEVLLNCGRKGVDARAIDNYAIKNTAENGEEEVAANSEEFLFTKEEVATFSEEIWGETLRIDWPGNLSRLPKDGFSTIKTGLDLVTSRSMYHRLCLLRQDLAVLTDLKRQSTNEGMWRWDLSEDDDYRNFRGRFVSFFSDLGSRLIQIPLRQCWYNELPEWITEDKLKDNDMLPNVATYCFDLAVETGSLSIVGTLLKIDGMRADPFISACLKGQLKMLLLSLNAYDTNSLSNAIESVCSFFCRVDVVKLLITVENRPEDYAARKATINAHFKVLEVLLAAVTEQ
ncbi:hypothetical protein HDU76_004970 [Blyttiomyces sp. JEL0837]|nr:hypothetical protein HDU76_004970 [Blyttiomyces sp. JEL0837]